MNDRSKQTTRLVLFLLAVLLASTLGRAGERSRSDSSSASPRLLLVWHDAHRLYPGTYRGVAREVSSLFASLDLEMRWQEAQQYDPELDDRTVLLRIVLMPSDPSGPGWHLGKDVMGAVLPSEGRARSVYIFYKNLVHGLKLRERDGRLPDLNERKLLERALGRVVAHEMIHAVAPSVSHAKWGLMRPGVTRSFLARDDVLVAAPVRRAFMAGVVNILSATSSPLAVGAPGQATPGGS